MASRAIGEYKAHEQEPGEPQMTSVALVQFYPHVLGLDARTRAPDHTEGSFYTTAVQFVQHSHATTRSWSKLEHEHTHEMGPKDKQRLNSSKSYGKEGVADLRRLVSLHYISTNHVQQYGFVRRVGANARAYCRSII